MSLNCATKKDLVRKTCLLVKLPLLMPTTPPSLIKTVILRLRRSHSGRQKESVCHSEEDLQKSPQSERHFGGRFTSCRIYEDWGQIYCKSHLRIIMLYL